jgi:hypothetical protein
MRIMEILLYQSDPAEPEPDSVDNTMQQLAAAFTRGGLVRRPLPIQPKISPATPSTAANCVDDLLGIELRSVDQRRPAVPG